MSIKELRQKLLSDIGSIGADLVEAWPDRPYPPMIWVTPSQPYLVTAQFRGEYAVSFDINIVVKRGSKAQMLDSLEALVESVLGNVADDWGITSVDQPQQVTVSGVDYFGTVITVNNLVKI